MTRSQVTVMWLGLFIVALNVVAHITEIKSVIFKTSPNPPQHTKKPGSNMGNPPPGTGKTA